MLHLSRLIVTNNGNEHSCSADFILQFCIDVTFEMRTVFSGIRLFNDDTQIDRPQFYIKKKWRGREQDSGETERECVCERLRVEER